MVYSNHVPASLNCPFPQSLAGRGTWERIQIRVVTGDRDLSQLVWVVCQWDLCPGRLRVTLNSGPNSHAGVKSFSLSPINKQTKLALSKFIFCKHVCYKFVESRECESAVCPGSQPCPEVQQAKHCHGVRGRVVPSALCYVASPSVLGAGLDATTWRHKTIRECPKECCKGYSMIPGYHMIYCVNGCK